MSRASELDFKPGFPWSESVVLSPALSTQTPRVGAWALRLALQCVSVHSPSCTWKFRALTPDSSETGVNYLLL